ncbi:MAG: hypothetical protein KY476_20100 [Planctomycetes bacterium]|nr:hypothetical protein [Planctomycetota bacterium]
MTPSGQQPVWLFDFALESETGEPVAAERAEQLLDMIVAWAEERQLQVGGGYRPPSDEELQQGSTFAEKDNPRQTSAAIVRK